jgi:hypothetical protein
MMHDYDVQVLHAIVAQHENDTQSFHMPLPGHTFTAIERVLWHYIIPLEGEESRLLEKMAPPHGNKNMQLQRSFRNPASGQFCLERAKREL